MARPACDMTGKKVGKLTAIKRVGSDHKNHALWLCECECGNTRIVRAYSLKGKNATKSCGCVTVKDLLKPSQKVFRDIVYTDLVRYAIVEQACKDYEWAIRYLNRLDHPGLTLSLTQRENVEKARMFLDNCERFFRGAWFARLVDLDGEKMIETLRKRAVEEKRAITRHKI